MLCENSPIEFTLGKYQTNYRSCSWSGERGTMRRGGRVCALDMRMTNQQSLILKTRIQIVGLAGIGAQPK